MRARLRCLPSRRRPNGCASSHLLLPSLSSHSRRHWLLVSWADAGAIPSCNGSSAKEESLIKHSFRHHWTLLEVAPNQAIAPSPLPLLHHADLGYQVWGDGTGAGLSHGTTMWRTTTIMETGTKTEFITTPSNFVPQFFLCFARVWFRA